MPTLWVTGASGVVGQKLVDQVVAAGRYDRICAWSHRAPTANISASPGVAGGAVAIGDREAVLRAAHAMPPDVVINPAAMTNVDACERLRVKARRANAEGPGHLADVCRARGAHLIHVSTDYVFPGDEA